MAQEMSQVEKMRNKEELIKHLKIVYQYANILLGNIPNSHYNQTRLEAIGDGINHVTNCAHELKTA